MPPFARNMSDDEPAVRSRELSESALSGFKYGGDVPEESLREQLGGQSLDGKTRNPQVSLCATPSARPGVSGATVRTLPAVCPSRKAPNIFAFTSTEIALRFAPCASSLVVVGVVSVCVSARTGDMRPLMRKRPRNNMTVSAVHCRAVQHSDGVLPPPILRTV